MLSGTPNLGKAVEFFGQAHSSIGQVRKYSGEPYFNHCLEVAEIVQKAGGDEITVIAALGHDVLEDVAPKVPERFFRREIKEIFGEEVLFLITSLTDYYTKARFPQLNRERRKKLELGRAKVLDHRAKLIKLADIISNTPSIVEHDEGFAKVYLKEVEELLEQLKGVHRELWEQASALVKKA